MATWTLAPSTTAALRLSSPLLRADRPPSAHRFHSLLPSRLRCRSIGTVQRGPAAGRGALGVRCGATVIDQGCFEAEVLHSESPVLVEFIADWCGPCRLIAPLVDWVAEEYKDSLKVVKVDHDANPKLIEGYKVYGLPTLILFKDGKEVPESRREGAMTKVKLKEYLDSLLKSLLIYHGTVRLQDWLVQTKSLALSFCLSSTQGKLK